MECFSEEGNIKAPRGTTSIQGLSYRPSQGAGQAGGNPALGIGQGQGQAEAGWAGPMAGSVGLRGAGHQPSCSGLKWGPVPQAVHEEALGRLVRDSEGWWCTLGPCRGASPLPCTANPHLEKIYRESLLPLLDL